MSRPGNDAGPSPRANGPTPPTHMAGPMSATR